jgi:hypothetical protein
VLGGVLGKALNSSTGYHSLHIHYALPIEPLGPGVQHELWGITRNHTKKALCKRKIVQQYVGSAFESTGS